MSVIELDLYAALEELRGAGAKIISVTRIKADLGRLFHGTGWQKSARKRRQIEVSGQ